jgi:aminomethyltransferase
MNITIETGGIMSDKQTPFYHIHQKLGAKIIPFAGYLMPVMYDSITAEHLRVRNSVGLFDLTHMGEFELTGSGAKDFTQKLVTNDVSKLAPNQVMYTCMCYEDGGIVDDLLVYNLKDRISLCVTASNIANDFAHIEKHKPANVNLTNLSDQDRASGDTGPDGREGDAPDYRFPAGNNQILPRRGGVKSPENKFSFREPVIRAKMVSNFISK